MSPFTSVRCDPASAVSTRFAGGASSGMNTWHSIPPRAQYDASAPPALPADGTVSRVSPSSFARDTAADSPRALNEPVGFWPSSFR